MENLADTRRDVEQGLREPSGRLHEPLVRDARHPIHGPGLSQSELEAQNEELRAAREELELSRKRYADLYEYAPVGYFIFDSNGLIQEVNHTGASLLEGSKSSLLGKPFSHFVFPGDSDILHAHCKEICGKKARNTCEIRLQKENGAVFYVQMESITVKDHAEGVSQCRTTVSDISDRKRAENVLQESEERFRVALKNSSIVVFNHDMELRYTWVYNPRMEYSALDILGKTDADIYSPEDAFRLMEIKRQVLTTGIGLREEVQVTQNGKQFSYDLTVEPLYGQNGGIAGVTCAAVDITGRKQVESALQESEGRFRAIFEQSKHGVTIGAADGKVIFYNNACESICGYTMDEVNRRGWRHLVLPETRRETIRMVSRALNGELPFVEFPLARKDGKVVWVSLAITPITVHGSKYIFSIATDTTENHRQAEELKTANEQLQEQKRELERLMQELIRHRSYLEDLVEERTAELKIANKHLGQEIMERLRAERGLREANELLEKVFSNIHVLVAYLDTDFRFIRVNRSYAEAEGHEPDFFAGKNHFDLFPNRENEIIFRKVIESGEPFFTYGRPFPYFKRYRRETEYWDFSLNPVRENDGRVSGVVLSLVNVTNRHRAVKALRESEKKFRKLFQEFHTLLDAIPDTLILLSPELKVLWANRGAASALGKEVSDITGRPCYALWHNRTAPCEKCCALRCFETGKEECAQNTISGKLLDSRAFPLRDEDGRVSNVIVLASDITEKTMLQAEVMRADHLASIGKLAAGVAHEINNPINGIINYAQILANKNREESRERDIAKRIIKEGDRIACIVRSLLSFARDRKQEKVPAQVSEILSDSLALIGAQMRKDCVELAMDVPVDLPEIIANPQQIQQVFLNVIDNARYALNRKYGGKHKDKVLAITGKTVTVNNVDYVRIAFYDRGGGMSAEMLEKAVNPFFSTKPSGTGLGLSISHGIISDHDGRLAIDSAEGEFTNVEIDLPAGKRKREQ